MIATRGSSSTPGVAGTVLVSATLAFACVPKQPTGDQATDVTPTSEPAAVEQLDCAESSPFTIATLEPSPSVRARAPCGIALELEQGQLAIRAVPTQGRGLVSATGLGELLATGLIPTECGPGFERCELWGVHDELGPILLAAVRGHESEAPVQVHVGWIEDQRIVFTPSWFGLPAIADHTRVGPAWVLAPFACEGELALLPANRLPEIGGEEPSDAVRMAAGHYAIAADGTTTIRPLAERTDACRPVFASLP